MKLLSTFRFHDQDQVEGKQATPMPDAREIEWREERLRLAMKSPWQEIPRARLKFGRFQIEDSATGELFEVVRGEVDVQHSPVAAWYVAEDGGPVFLERPAGARTVGELAAHRAARDQAAAARRRPRVRS